MNDTAYSVIIPAYNAAETIGEAIHSILQQSVTPKEIIVIDDGSIDDTGKIAEEVDPRVTVIHQSNRGPGAATSLGISHISTPLFAALDADDLWLPQKMQTQLAYLDANPSCGLVFAQMKTFRNDGETDGIDVISPGWSRITMVARTESARRIGDIVDPPGMRGEMIDWFARARAIGIRMDMLDTVLSLRRIRLGSLSYGRSDEQDKGYARVALMALRRRKGLLK